MSFPEVINYNAPGYATWINGRSPQFKAHTHLGLAKSALRYHGMSWDTTGTFCTDMGLYQLTLDGDKLVWKLVAHIKEGTTTDDYPEIWKQKK